MARTPDGPPPPPVVQRLRLRFTKRGRLRFTSHRDFQRALERAVRRAGVPVAYSAGFNPHPKISYAGAAPTGAASEAEYLEIALSTKVEPDALRAALDEALPTGLDVVEVVETAGGALADRLVASEWIVELPGVTPEEAATAVVTFLAADRVEVTRLTKNGNRTFDARGAVVRLGVVDTLPDLLVRAGAQVPPPPCAILNLVVRHTTPAVRPDDVLAALRSQALLAPPSPSRMTRLAQGPLDEADGTVADPLTADRNAAGA
ncbi:TIGR03936 family radical SAM-associated protein [Kineosporia sp. A_224]|uniref:TIGR03936 family radical SAM-associated protein n=1 Tax=Kineosporia sp. A_224 TaxID=1962180 RepID=UPI0018E9B5B9|nr:TIGR03936 family radical SAM-associated protein [Kineosporia sp. A_224]